MHNNDACGTLTLVELKMAFTTFAKQNLNGFKICLFIDGLDEYAGDQNEILDLFKTITSNSAIKAVVSSRPEPAFEEAFRKSPKLRVENLTSGDIKHYIKSKLLSHSRMESEMEGGSKLGARLIASIASKASGVFLWVFLVVRLLLDRLSKESTQKPLNQSSKRIQRNFKSSTNTCSSNVWTRCTEQRPLGSFKPSTVLEWLSRRFPQHYVCLSWTETNLLPLYIRSGNA